MMAKLVLLLLLATLALAANRRPKWNQLEGYTFDRYVKDFHKQPGTEHHMRKTLFESRLKTIRTHNAKATSTYKMGVNHLTDRTDSELSNMRGSRINQMHNVAKTIDERHVQYNLRGGPLPREIDYRTAQPAVLTAIKDQGQCGSCWAHGATECVESHSAIYGDTGLWVLSQEQVNSCAPNPNDCGGVGGCGGSIVELAYDYLVGAGGQTEEWMYSYQSYWGNTSECIVQSNKTWLPVVSITGYTKLPSNDQDSILDALANVGPLAINVDASTWYLYESGVFDGCSYAKNISIDHVVQLVGYGHDQYLNVDYWIVRNSWSPLFGESGFIRLLRTGQESCGWDVLPQDGTGCKGGPPQLWACGMCGLAFDVLYPNIS